MGQARTARMAPVPLPVLLLVWDALPVLPAAAEPLCAAHSPASKHHIHIPTLQATDRMAGAR